MQRGGAYYSESAAALMADVLRRRRAPCRSSTCATTGRSPNLPDDVVVEMPARIGRDGRDARSRPARCGADLDALVRSRQGLRAAHDRGSAERRRSLAALALMTNPLGPDASLAPAVWERLRQRQRGPLRASSMADAPARDRGGRRCDEDRRGRLRRRRPRARLRARRHLELGDRRARRRGERRRAAPSDGALAAAGLRRDDARCDRLRARRRRLAVRSPAPRDALAGIGAAADSWSPTTPSPRCARARRGPHGCVSVGRHGRGRCGPQRGGRDLPDDGGGLRRARRRRRHRASGALDAVARCAMVGAPQTLLRRAAAGALGVPLVDDALRAIKRPQASMRRRVAPLVLDGGRRRATASIDVAARRRVVVWPRGAAASRARWRCSTAVRARDRRAASLSPGVARSTTRSPFVAAAHRRRLAAPQRARGSRSLLEPAPWSAPAEAHARAARRGAASAVRVVHGARDRRAAGGRRGARWPWSPSRPARSPPRCAHAGCDRVVLVARGTSDHVAIYARYLLEARCALSASLAAPSLYTDLPRRRSTSRARSCSASRSPARRPRSSRRSSSPGRAARSPRRSRTTPGSPLAASVRSRARDAAGEERSVAATKTFTTRSRRSPARRAPRRDRPRGAARDAPRALEAAEALPEARPSRRPPRSSARRRRGGLRRARLRLRDRARGCAQAQGGHRPLGRGVLAADLRHGPRGGRARPAGARPACRRPARRATSTASSASSRQPARPSSRSARARSLPAAEGLCEELAPIALIDARAARRGAARACCAGRDPDAPPGLTKVTPTH